MLHLFCALKCEATPIIDHLKLVNNNNAGLFRVCTDKDSSMSLTITGTGKVAAASAAIYTCMALSGSKTDIWLNIGIAGHARFDRGQAVLAGKILERSSGKAWYPQVLFDTDIPLMTLTTLDIPSSSYEEDAVFDMEAAGFYQTVSRFGTAELCHSLKIISDNRLSDFSKITANDVSQLIAGTLGNIDSLISNLIKVRDALPSPVQPGNIYDVIISRWHFTHAERLRLGNILKRWRILFPDAPLSLDEINSCRESSLVLAALNSRLDAAMFRFGEKPWL